MKETIQLHFGSFSDRIGSEMINMEFDRLRRGDDQIDHDSFLYSMETGSNTSVQPRVVAYDFADNLNSSKRAVGEKFDFSNMLDYEKGEPSGDVIRIPCRLQRHDMFRIRGDDERRFATVSDTVEYLQANNAVRDDALEPIRYQMERCDHVEAIHSLLDVNHGFAALSAALLADIQDQYCRASTTSFVTFGAEERAAPDVPGRLHQRYDLNRFMAFATMLPLSSVFVPMCSSASPNDVPMGQHALALHVCTSAYRLRSSTGWKAREVLERLTSSSRNVGSMLLIASDATNTGQILLLNDERLHGDVTHPISNDHIVLQGDPQTCSKMLDQIPLQRGQINSDQTELSTCVRIRPGSHLAMHLQSRYSHPVLHLHALGQWQSSESAFKYVNRLWQKTTELRSTEAGRLNPDLFESCAELIANLEADLIYDRSRHVVRRAPQIRVVHYPKE